MSKTALLSFVLGCTLGAGAAVVALHGSSPGAGSARGSGVALRPGEDPAARLHDIIVGTNALRRVADLGVLLPTLDPSTAGSVAEVFETSAVDAGDPELILYGMWWAEHDPEAALEWTRTDWRARHANVIAAVVRVWAHKNPQAALTAARALNFQNQREIATDAAVAGWDESGLPGLMESLSQFNQIQQQQICEGIARRRVVALGPEGALRWADGLPESPLKPVLSVRVASAVAADRKGAPLVAEWARPRVLQGKGQISNYPRRIATRWVHHDPGAAMAWLASLPAGDDRDDGVAESFRTWLRHDARAAHAWMEKIEVQPWNEPAIATFARAIAYERPKDAIEMARRLTSEGWREPTTIVVGQVWMGKDSEAANAWLAQADLPEHTRKTAAMKRDSNPANAGRLERFQRDPATQAQAGGALTR